MANHYFEFKQFTIYQQNCAMKVCTDACILGAWTANAIIGNQLPVNHCLDIGAGTGLLSVMLAQKTAAIVHAVEMEPGAVKQTLDNFALSQWTERLHVFETDARYFSAPLQYDFIITNPPFYKDDLLSPEKNNNLARHDKGLTLDELVLVIRKNLHPAGSFSLLLPYRRSNYFEGIAAKQGFFLQQRLLVKQTPEHNYFRAVLLFGQTSTPVRSTELTIKNGKDYTEEFVSLMRDFYLRL